jgi:hypothetical protein
MISSITSFSFYKLISYISKNIYQYANSKIMKRARNCFFYLFCSPRYTITWAQPILYSNPIYAQSIRLPISLVSVSLVLPLSFTYRHKPETLPHQSSPPVARAFERMDTCQTGTPDLGVLIKQGAEAVCFSSQVLLTSDCSHFLGVCILINFCFIFTVFTEDLFVKFCWTQVHSEREVF